MKDILKARQAILDELRRRGKAGDPEVKPSTVDRKQDNQWIGYGSMDCPVCKSGTLRYGRASNLHIHGSCTTSSCVRWME